MSTKLNYEQFVNPSLKSIIADGTFKSIIQLTSSFGGACLILSRLYARETGATGALWSFQTLIDGIAVPGSNMSQTFVASAQHIIAFSLITTLDNGSLINIEGGSAPSTSVLAFNGTTPLLIAIQLAN